MFTVIGIMVVGIVFGYLLRKKLFIRQTGKLISCTIILLLFLLGITVGANRDIMMNLTTLGGQALLLSVGSVGGSVICAWVVYRFFFDGRVAK